jgi:hypothetical protein
MSKRISRKAIALAAVAALAAPFAMSASSNAQTSTSPTITVSAKASGTVPTGVSGVNVTITCKNLLGGGSNTNTYGITFGAAGLVTYWPLTGPAAAITGPPAIPANPGTSCVVGAVRAGTANLDKGSVSIAVGGVNRDLNSAGQTADLPLQSSSDVVVTVTYPQITIKKVVTGAEPTAGFAYTIAVNCSDTRTPFIQTLTTDVNVPVGSLVVNGPGTFVTLAGIRYFDVRTSLPVAVGPLASDLVGTAAIVGAQPLITAASLATFAFNVALAPAGTIAGAVIFNGTVALKGGESKVLGINEIPGLTTTSVCEAIETNSNGAPSLSYASSVANADGTIGSLPGTLTPATGTTPAIFRSALTKVGQTITVNNAFLYYGALFVSKVVTGDPKTNISTFEISVSCNNGGPKDTFLLKDRQTKIYDGILEGTSCQIIETKSDGAVASYTDNSGDVTTDGRIVIKRAVTGCLQPGAPTAATPGTVGSIFNDCAANVIVTNNYNPPPTTAAPAPAAAAPAAAPATTAAPAVTPAPAVAVEATPTFAG